MSQFSNVDLKKLAKSTMQKYGFDPFFSDDIIDEIGSLNPEILLKKQKKTMDLRNLLWSSIDNFDSMDLDQIEFARKNPDGSIEIYIAIADVDVFVPKASHTDKRAAHNGTSVYTGIETFPMLPDRLSADISSLLPGNECMAVVISYTVLENGEINRGDIFRAVVSNKAKLVYETIGDWLEGKTEVPESVYKIQGLNEQILIQNEAALLLKKRRIKEGALVLQTIEASPLIEDGKVIDLVIQEQNTARNIIEEFMVAANKTVVSFISNAKMPMIQRVVKQPKDWEGIVATAKRYGEKLPAKPNSRALTKFLIRQLKNDPERFPDLSVTIIKLIGQGEYMPLKAGKSPVGHFALAVTDYTHATAPNRRYVDLINQRLVKAALKSKKCPYTFEELDEHAQWLSDRERASKKVERFMRKAAAAVLLQDRINDVFDGFVTGSSVKGVYARLINPPAEGRVMEGEKNLFVGEKVKLKLILVDPYNGYIDFECIGRENDSQN
ncbi:RNB domain-containing ribonuclease [Methanomicrobium antiquum]|uniref:RNB domain-containing ribonuclease n=1 Tax=Methanomicrobium antiquum TaxID=487686 RepID=A0AAF0FX02_9EURY|nr:RNB domain-containing ribonuclease [Methanomicrobium antiquum]WFN37883.1 RNB domain-containing ribonuclease [Methanomicrobium antiquum]